MKKLLLILILVFPAILQAQEPTFTILCLAAHPDDEDGATLAYYRYLHGYDAYTIFYTRGEGGQNETGPQLYDELGKLREQECYDAAKIQGSKAFFLGELDFGFSKTAKETFSFWGGKDSLLARLVYMIRVIKPDVVITNHDTITTKPNRQHGHHQAVGITIYEAFDKAADPNYHPEQLVYGIEPWQIKKLFFRSYDTTASDLYKIDISKKTSSGSTIAEISRDALFQHKTQGMDKVSKDSPFFFGNRFYRLIRSDTQYELNGDDLFSGLVHNMKWNTSELRSYDTKYSYRNVSAEDSLKMLNFLTFDKNVKIGLVKTYDNTLENIFKAFDIKYENITESDFGKEISDEYSTIILDIRAYLYRKDLVKYNYRILDYIKKGGNVICFYNKPTEWNDNGFSPYPIYLTNERVTDENSPIKLLENGHPFFNKPNFIGFNTWINWVQERNVYLPSNDTNRTSNKYQRLIEMNDENDPVSPTSILWAEYGKGTYTYCSIALYRQLKIFNYGSVSLFLNMISQKSNF